MNRTNLILLVALAGLATVWATRRDWGGSTTKTALAPPMFPDFNREAVDKIEISGGWLQDAFTLTRLGSEWRLSSHGEYPAKAEAADKFIEAVAALRKENPVGTSPTVQAQTRTDEKNGRLVKVYKAGTVMAAFRIGKNPKGYSSQEVFVRPEDSEAVFRTRTVPDSETGSDPFGSPYGARAFDWHNYTFRVSTQWLDSKIWSLSGEEAQMLWLTREDIDAKLKKIGDDDWDLIEKGNKPVKADTDAADSILSQLRNLYHSGVAGRYDAVRDRTGLDSPAITLVMELKRKVEQKDEDGGEKKDDNGEGGDKEEEEKKEDEYVTVKRVIEVGAKIKRTKSYDPKTFELETEEVYPIRVSSDVEADAEQKLSAWVFYVNANSVGGLRKTIDELKREEAEPEGGTGDGAPDDKGDEGDEGDGGTDEGGTDDPDAGGTNKDDPKGDDPKTDEPKSDEPKSDDPKKDDPKKDDPKKDDPKTDDPNKGDGCGA